MRNSKTQLLFSVVALLLLFVAPLVGPESLVFSELRSLDSPSGRILYELRVPRISFTLIAGGSLAILGGCYQALFRNALAEPYVLGVSSAVTLAVVVAHIYFGVPPLSFRSAMAGFLGAGLAIGLLFIMAYSRFGDEMDRLILFGMGINFILSSILFLILSYAHQNLGGGSLRWLFGQIAWLSPKEAGVFLACSISLLIPLFVFARNLDTLSFGDSVARTLGGQPDRVRLFYLLLTSIFVALIVSFSGAVGFVGLVVPHAVRLIFRPATSRALFLHSFILGALFLTFSDILGRVLLPPFEFPVGIMTTIVGAPLFLYLLWRR